MTSDTPQGVLATAQDGPPPHRVVTPVSPDPPPAGRLLGVDLARGVAVLGMYAAHVGPDPAVGGLVGHVMEATHGRSSALFALLAGFSLVLITGRSRPRTGRRGRQAAGKILIRAAVLLVAGTALTSMGTPVDVILAYYGLTFVVALPLYRLPQRALAMTAGVSALVLPQVLYAVRVSATDGVWAASIVDNDPLARISGTDGVMGLLLTGDYPVLSWVPFVIAGMAVARLDLTTAAVRGRLLLTGAALMVAGYGTSWLMLHLLPQARAAISAVTDGASSSSAWWSDTMGGPTANTPAWLMVAAPHSETTPSIVGNTGVALVVIVCCFTVVERHRRLRTLAAPVTAIGTMSLTAYVAHILVIRALGIENVPGSPLWMLCCFVVAMMAFAMVWKRHFRRGPLESLLNTATAPAKYIR
ncbi:DUF418 domain-containing protein [Streptomyces rimosus]|uniref:DUF418 domain-containing protein n=1 Tax=Streptomyces rimosus TaxID=1927 RepID=UPI00099F1954|nr:DUF418 domain-containing protein [Streptomyces rimosus]